jgi:hypothetical protein
LREKDWKLYYECEEKKEAWDEAGMTIFEAMVDSSYPFGQIADRYTETSEILITTLASI